MEGLVKPKTALVSVSDKAHLDQLVEILTQHHINIISTGGTYQALKSLGAQATEVAQYTQSPEILNGRVKTLHPKIHGGLLGDLNLEKHQQDMTQENIEPIDLVVVNLYPFEQTLTQNPTYAQAIEKIDIGGPSMIRSAAKNHGRVTVVTDPSQYTVLAEVLSENKGHITETFRKMCAAQAFQCTALYEASIARFFQEQKPDFPKNFPLGLNQKQSLRYGENPHQKGAFTMLGSLDQTSMIDSQLQGKALSYNNIMDVHAAVDMMCDVACGPTVGIFKHANPCGVGRSTSLLNAYTLALSCDPTSAFGGIVIFSDQVGEAEAKACTQIFTEIVIAPSFSDQAKSIFAKKKNLRLLEINIQEARKKMQPFEVKRALDGYLVQEADDHIESIKTCPTVSTRQPTESEYMAMDLAWKVSKHVKSNAIVLCSHDKTIGIGAGQMSRVDATQIALSRLKKDTSGIKALGSDAFFPFRDSIDLIAKHGVTCIVQPGGSIRDQDVIDAANEHNLAMVFTGVRHFKH